MNLKSVSSVELLEELVSRGGHPGALAKAAVLSLKKAEDYSNATGVDPAKIDRSNYFPFGAISFAQMIHTKSQRFVALAPKQKTQANFESLADTALDLINYAGFYLASLETLNASVESNSDKSTPSRG